MSEFKNIFEHKKVEDGLKKPYEELKTPFKKETYEKGSLDEEKNREEEPIQKSEQEYYDTIIEELRSKKRGGADIHLSQIKIADLNKEALDLYKLHSQDKLEEKTIRSFLAKVEPGSNEYNLGAMLLNWSFDKVERKRTEEKEKFKEEARQKLDELKRKNPHIVAHIDNIDLTLLTSLDLKAISNIDQADPADLGEYKNRLREYFGNKTKGKPDQELIIIENDPRFKCYCALKGILELGSCSPEEFIK